MHAIRAVLFDFDHTLGVDNKLEEEALRETAAAVCTASPSDESVQAVLHRFRYEPGVPLETAVGDGLKSWGCPPDKIAHGVSMFRARALELAPLRVKPMPGAPEMLAQLAARGFNLGILSNGWTQLQHLKAQLIGFPGPVLASEELGAWKPEKKAFDLALSRLSMDAPTTLYVGDNPAVDIAGAKGAGLFAAWFDPQNEPYPADAVLPDLTITALDQLPAQLEQASV